MSRGRWKRLAVVVAALAPVLVATGSPTQASVSGECEGAATGILQPGYVRTSPDVAACVYWWTPVAGPHVTIGLFFTPSQPVTTSGSETTVRFSGGVCARVRSIELWNYRQAQCIHDPTFSVSAGSYGYNSQWYGTGTVVYGSTRPCVDTTPYSGGPGLWGYGVGAACASASTQGDVGTKNGASWLAVVPGLCLSTSSTWLCVRIDSTTKASGSPSQRIAVCTGGAGAAWLCDPDVTVPL